MNAPLKILVALFVIISWVALGTPGGSVLAALLVAILWVGVPALIIWIHLKVLAFLIRFLLKFF